VYIRNIRRIYKLSGGTKDAVPLDKRWVNSQTFIDKYKKFKVNIRRHLSLAAVKFLQTIGEKHVSWSERMEKDSIQYKANRNKNIKSSFEKERWLKNGWKDIRKAATEFWRRNKTSILKQPHTIRKLYNYQTFLILRLFSEIPFRNTFATFELKDKNKNNYIRVPKKGSIILVVRDYKNVKQLGIKEIKLSRGLTTQVRKFLKYRSGVVDNNFFLNNIRGEKMTRSAMGKMLIRNTSKLLNKRVGSRIIRLLAASDNKESILKLQDLSNKLLHTSEQTKQYVRKE